jgi:acetylornithine deacetylase/succinyl-diaminopimelate desuccinylase-like protein
MFVWLRRRQLSEKGIRWSMRTSCNAAPGADGKPKPTVLCYGHYDMPPTEPFDEWTSPPFEPTERHGNLYARGAVDDKGQMWMHVKALESLMVAGGSTLPVNVRVIFEGEEEIGGKGIAAFVQEHIRMS